MCAKKGDFDAGRCLCDCTQIPRGNRRARGRSQDADAMNHSGGIHQDMLISRPPRRGGVACLQVVRAAQGPGPKLTIRVRCTGLTSVKPCRNMHHHITERHIYPESGGRCAQDGFVQQLPVVQLRIPTYVRARGFTATGLRDLQLDTEIIEPSLIARY